MCFSNLPVEFDEDGDPYLAEEADGVERPAVGVVDGGAEDGTDADLAADPEAAYEEIVSSLRTDAREHVDDATRARPDGDSESAEGD